MRGPHFLMLMNNASNHSHFTTALGILIWISGPCDVALSSTSRQQNHPIDGVCFLMYQHLPYPADCMEKAERIS
jgi:hypothetical protein